MDREQSKLIRSTTNEGRLYIGNLPQDVRNRDIEDIFYKFGRIAAVDVHNRYSPAFAFVEFEDPRDAKDAVHARDGYDFDGYRIRVEFPRGCSNRDRDGFGGRGGGFSRGRGRGRGSGPPRRSDHRIVISGLPPTGSWQDVKDHMREAGDVLYTDVFKDGTGVVEFSSRDDMKWAIKNLDDTKFRSHEGETSFVRVKEDGPSNGSRSRSFSPARIYGGRSTSRSPRHSRSRSRTPRRRRSRSPRYSRSRSRSPKRQRSRSRSRRRRSRSRSRSKRYRSRSGSRRHRSRSRSRSGSRRRRSRSRKHRSRSRSRSRRHRSRSGSKSRRSRSGSRKRSGSRRRSRSGSERRSNSPRSRSKSLSKRRSHERSRSRGQSHDRSKSKSRSRSKQPSRSRSRSRSV